MSFNKVILQGRLTEVPELKKTPSDIYVTSFSIAVDRKMKLGEEKKTNFINIVAWRSTAEFICKYFNKGNQILICGELQTRNYEDKQGNKRVAVEVVASEVAFCGTKNENTDNFTQETRNASTSENSALEQAKFEDVNPDDDLPF
jgi:single-strand DNA-binding protein